jgi:hypothetical protein
MGNTSMEIKRFFRNALARVHRTSFATQVSFLSSQALDTTCRLAATLERFEARRGVPMLEIDRKKVEDDLNFQFGVLLDTLCELQAAAARQPQP